MRTISLNHLPANVAAVLATSIKITAALLVLSYAVLHFSAAHWVLLGLFSVCVLAIMNRLAHLDIGVQKKKNSTQKIITADGGTFHRAGENKTAQCLGPIVYDGGIAKHKVAK